MYRVMKDNFGISFSSFMIPALEKESDEWDLNATFGSRKKLFSEEECIHGDPLQRLRFLWGNGLNVTC